MSAEEGRDLRALADRPEVEPHLQWVWRAFWDLQGDRQLGFGGFGPIMWASINGYGRRGRITDDRFERLVTMIRCMDREWLKAAEKPQEQKPGKR
jgi:hypothetical protein